MDSSGMAVIDTDTRDLSWQKLPLTGSMFIQDKFAKVLMEDAKRTNSISICHTRAATSGRIGINEAHPFIATREDDDRMLVGVHNGTLTSWHGHKTAKLFSVDSEWALNHIYDEGEAAFKDFRGAYAFVWWDNKDDAVLNVALNDQRTLFVAFTKDGGMAYASEAGMLYWLLERNSMKVEGHVIQLSADHWYKFPMGNLADFGKTKLPAPPTTTTTYHNYPNRTYVPVMEKVGIVLAKFLDKVSGSAASQPAPAAPAALTVASSTKVPAVTVDEAANAKALGIQNVRGTFMPGFEDTNDETTGMVYLSDGTEMEAIIRNSAALQYTSDTLWEVTCLGVVDDGEKLTAVCSKPRVVLSSNVSKAKAEAVH